MSVTPTLNQVFGSCGRLYVLTVSYYEYSELDLERDIDTRSRQTPYKYYEGKQLFGILTKMISACDFLNSVKDGGRHGDIRPRNIIWDGVSNLSLTIAI